MLPVRNGIGPSCVGLPAGPWPSLLAFLVQRFPAISADWTTGTEKIWAWAEYDAATTGNLLNWGGLTTVQSILNGQAAPSFSAAQLTQTVGN